MSGFELSSASTGAKLTLLALGGDMVLAQIETAYTVTKKKVDMYMSEQVFLDFFKGISKCQKAWEGPRECSTIDGDFELCANCDSFGHVTFEVTLRQDMIREPWKVQCSIASELGLLPSILSDAEMFFAE